jgi:3-oxoacyl-[acyl-carrier protein] reductase
LDAFGRLDVVVANAVIELVGQSVLDFTEADFDRLFAINTKGAFFTLQKAAKYVADRGRIIYIGSSNTAFPLPGRALYGGSKLAPQFLVEVLAKEIGSRGVAVNSDEVTSDFTAPTLPTPRSSARSPTGFRQREGRQS